MIHELKDFSFSNEYIDLKSFKVIKNDFDNHVINCIDYISKDLNGKEEIELSLSKRNGTSSSYEIIISNHIEIIANINGIFPALSTLMYLLYKNDSKLFKGSIKDNARFEYRAFMLDEARHFQGKETVKEYLDILFKLKYNVFHFHISDDQGFRIEIPGFEKLVEYSSHRDDSYVGGYYKNHSNNNPHEGYYSIEDVKEIVNYAKDRGIKIVPEIDIPGHTSAIIACFKEYSCFNKQIDIPGSYGVKKNILCLGKSKVRQFIKDLLSSLVEFFETDSIHLGFDEIKTDYMNDCIDCKKYAMSKGYNDVSMIIEDFRYELERFFDSKQIKTSFWNDAISFSEVDLLATSIYWKKLKNKEQYDLINKGQKTIIAPFFYYYLDYPYALTPLRKTYNFNPILKGVLKKENIIGIETPMWTEYVTNKDKLNFNSLYRLAAISTTGWNNKKVKYKQFIKNLKEDEIFFFNKKMDIKNSILNPMFRLVKVFIACFYDNNKELKKYLKKKK